MKNRASLLLKPMIAALSSMAKSKTLAIKTKTNAIKARLIIFSLLRNRKFLMSSISHKFQSVLGHHSHPKEENFLEDGNDESKPIVNFNSNARSYEALPNPSETQVAEEDRVPFCFKSYNRYEDEEEGDEDRKYPDLTHSLFESEDLDFGGSVIDHVKNSKEEAGQEFKLEDEIDRAADLFIRKFRRQMILQKQNSLKRCQEMLEMGA
ncbi:hypothetical protein L6164_004865 [Bauhinia variegata]|uniref:Uncharacterized protein n=1 Tax=Bauhinia variegata TaxID=167791 RepID=A0ACB9PPD8_BAUVA|nr:hypothetical protein L6164_004865 [Bauhinia variegata]